MLTHSGETGRRFLASAARGESFRGVNDLLERGQNVPRICVYRFIESYLLDK